MKQASKHFLCLLLAVTYVFAYMGFGIHTCHDDGSRHFVWMLGDVSCEAIHHHSHGSDHDHHHDGHCCTTQIFVLTDAQDNAPAAANLSAPEISLPLLAEAEALAPVFAGHHPLLPLDSPPPIRDCITALLSVWLI